MLALGRMTQQDTKTAAPDRVESRGRAAGDIRYRGMRLLRLCALVALLVGMGLATEFGATHAPLWFSGAAGWALAAFLCFLVFGALGAVFGWLLGGADDLYRVTIPAAIMFAFLSLMAADSILGDGLGLLLAGAVIATALVLGQLLAERWRASRRSVEAALD